MINIRTIYFFHNKYILAYFCCEIGKFYILQIFKRIHFKFQIYFIKIVPNIFQKTATLKLVHKFIRIAFLK